MIDSQVHDFGRQLRVAEAYLDAGNHDAAIAAAKEILQNSLQSLDGLELLARAQMAKGNNAAAEDTARDLIAADPEADAGHRLLALAALNQGNKRLAKEEALKAVEIGPYEPTNYLALALACEARDEFKECEAAYKEALDLYPEFTAAKTSYADFLLNRGREDEARQLHKEASDEAAGNIDVILLRGTLALRDGRLDEAYENALWALQQDAVDPRAVNLMAQIKMRKNPILGIWWRYAVVMGRFTFRQQIMVCIGIYVVWQFAYRGFLRTMPDPIPTISVVLWFAFCILTWVGPGILKRMVRRELRSVEIKQF